MRILFFDAHAFEKREFERANSDFRNSITFTESRLTEESAALAKGYEAVCCFVNDRLSAKILWDLKKGGVRLIALRSAGFNHIDMKAARELGLKVVRVPEYSPYAVAEFAVLLALTLNRKVHRAFNRTRELNFSLEGLVGFDFRGKTVGIVGTGKIGKVAAKIFRGFGCRVVAVDLAPDHEFSRSTGVEYVDRAELFRSSDIVSLHVPLAQSTYHMVDESVFLQMQPAALLINTGRGALIDTKALISALKANKLGGAALDVYEEEENIFFQDHSADGISDDSLARLLTFPNVLVTSHQAFLTNEALQAIAQTTLQSVSDFEANKTLKHEL